MFLGLVSVLSSKIAKKDWVGSYSVNKVVLLRNNTEFLFFFFSWLTINVL